MEHEYEQFFLNLFTSDCKANTFCLKMLTVMVTLLSLKKMIIIISNKKGLLGHITKKTLDFCFPTLECFATLYIFEIILVLLIFIF